MINRVHNVRKIVVKRTVEILLLVIFSELTLPTQCVSMRLIGICRVATILLILLCLSHYLVCKELCEIILYSNIPIEERFLEDEVPP